MKIRIGFEITLNCDTPTPIILALSPRPEEEHRLIGSSHVHSDPALPLTPYLDEFGNRRVRLVAPAGVPLKLWSDCMARDNGLPDRADMSAPAHPVEDLPADTLVYLAASRFCESDRLLDDAWRTFGHMTPGWTMVQAICDHVHQHITFGYEHARVTMTALDAWNERRGVCRDFAHLAIALCRAMNIPARYASGYLSDIGVTPTGPGDFCAWMEVYLGGRWHTFDPRNNTPRIGRVLMVRGRDAADVPMIAAFGNCPLAGFTVWTDEVDKDAVGTPWTAEAALDAALV